MLNRVLQRLTDNGAWVVGGAVFAVLAMFAGKAPHVDDVLFLRSAHAINSGLGPFGASINWEGFDQSLFEAALNPPLVPGLLALAERAGASAVGMHLLLALVAAWGAVGVHALARRCGAPGLLGALLACAAPAFLVSATNLMCDVTMTSFFTWAVVYLLRAWDSDDGSDWRPWLGFVGCATAAYASKYFGISLLVLAPVAALLLRQRIKATLIATLATAVLIAGLDAVFSAGHGRSHLLLAMVYAKSNGSTLPILQQIIVDTVYVGLCLLPGALLALTLDKRAWLVVALVTTAVTGAAFAGGSLGDLQLRGALMPLVLGHMVVGCGVSAMALIVFFTDFKDTLKSRDPAHALLLMWAAGTLVFAVVVNWTLAARSLLPMVVPLAILTAQRLSGVDPRRVVLLLVPVVSITLVLAHADEVAAATEVQMAEHAATIVPKDHSRFIGHWGFQAAMEGQGFVPYDASVDTLAVGDTLLWIERKYTRTLQGNPAYRAEPPVRFSPAAWATTINKVGFYSAFYGALPFVVGHAFEHRLWLAHVEQEVKPTPRPAP